MHETLNQQREKYLADAYLIKRYVSLPTTKVSPKYDYHGDDQTFLTNSEFKMFKKKENFKTNNSQNISHNKSSQNEFTPTSIDSRNESFRDSSSFASSSVMSLNTGVSMSAHQQNSNTQSNAKLLYQNNNNSKKPLKKLSEEISIGGKQILEQPPQQQHQIPVISNAKVEYCQKNKPLNLESINRIRKLLNLDEENETHAQQQQQPQTHITKSNSTNSSFGNLKLKLRESRLRHTLKSDNKTFSTADNNALLVQNLRNMKKNAELSSDSLNVKSRLPIINQKNAKTDENRYQFFNTFEDKIFKSTDEPLIIDRLTYISPKKNYNEESSSELKKQQTTNNHYIESCFLCNHHTEDTEAATPDLKPLITIITKSKPTNNNSQFYVQHKNGLLYNQSSYKNYRSPAPSPEVLI
jgi:hypothetical protein